MNAVVIGEETRNSGQRFMDWLSSSMSEFRDINPMSASLQMFPVDVAPGQATVRYEFNASHTNFMGIVHGGIVSTALDDACGIVACGTVGEGFRGTSVIQCQFFEPVRPGTYRIEARVVRATRNQLFVDASLYGDTVEPLARACATIAYGAVRPS